MLHQFFKNFGLLTESEISTVLSYFKLKTYKKDTILVNFGEINDKFYFVEVGLLREFSEQEQEQEQEQGQKQEQDNTVTHWFLAENSFQYLVASFLEQKPSEVALEVIENTKLWEITKTDLDKLYVEFPQLNAIGRVLLEENLKKYERYNAMTRLSADDRLEWFNKNYPELANRVSVRHIATFLHLHRVTLSKVRSKKSK